MIRSVHQPTPAMQAGRDPVDSPTNQPIGVFDSGIGGLTVVKELMKQLPDEPIIYLGDTARVPYGTKSDRTIKAFTLQSCLFLLEHDVKMIIVACNTASAVALDFISNMFRIPVLGVIVPGSMAAVEKTRNKRVGVIGTHTTVNSQSYTKTIGGIDQEVRVFSKACPLLVPIAEEGWLRHDVTTHVCNEYLSAFQSTEIDTLVMGCTHYPVLSGAIEAAISKIMDHPVELIDSGVETAKLASTVLAARRLLHGQEPARPVHRFYVTDLPKNFERVGEMFLGSPIDHLDVVTVESMGF